MEQELRNLIDLATAGYILEKNVDQSKLSDQDMVKLWLDHALAFRNNLIRNNLLEYAKTTHKLIYEAAVDNRALMENSIMGLAGVLRDYEKNNKAKAKKSLS